MPDGDGTAVLHVGTIDGPPCLGRDARRQPGVPSPRTVHAVGPPHERAGLGDRVGTAGRHQGPSIRGSASGRPASAARPQASRVHARSRCQGPGTCSSRARAAGRSSSAASALAVTVRLSRTGSVRMNSWRPRAGWAPSGPRYSPNTSAAARAWAADQSGTAVTAPAAAPASSTGRTSPRPGGMRDSGAVSALDRSPTRHNRAVAPATADAGASPGHTGSRAAAASRARVAKRVAAS